MCHDVVEHEVAGLRGDTDEVDQHLCPVLDVDSIR